MFYNTTRASANTTNLASEAGRKSFNHGKYRACKTCALGSEHVLTQEQKLMRPKGEVEELWEDKNNFMLRSDEDQTCSLLSRKGMLYFSSPQKASELTGVPSLSLEDASSKRSLSDLKKRIRELEGKDILFFETFQKEDELLAKKEILYKEQLSVAEETERVLRERIKHLDTKAKLSTDLGQQESLLNQLETLQKENSGLINQIRALETKNKRLKDEGEDLYTTLNSLETELNRGNDIKIEPQSELLDSENTDCNALKRHISRLETEKEDVENEYKNQINNLNNQLSKSSQDFQLLHYTNCELTKNMQALQADVIELEKALEEQKIEANLERIQMCQTITEKDKELEAIKHQTQVPQLPKQTDTLSSPSTNAFHISMGKTNKNLLETNLKLERKIIQFGKEKQIMEKRIKELEEQVRWMVMERENLKNYYEGQEMKKIDRTRQLYIENSSASELALQATVAVLQQNCKTKNHLIEVLANYLLERSSACSFEEVLKNVVEIQHHSQPSHDFDREFLCRYLLSNKCIIKVLPRLAGGKRPESARYRPRMGSLDFRIVRRVGPNALLFTWNAAQNEDIIGYEIFINGSFAHKVRSGRRNLALVQGLDLNARMVIRLHVLSFDDDIVDDAVIAYPIKMREVAANEHHLHNMHHCKK